MILVVKEELINTEEINNFIKKINPQEIFIETNKIVNFNELKIKNLKFNIILEDFVQKDNEINNFISTLIKNNFEVYIYNLFSKNTLLLETKKLYDYAKFYKDLGVSQIIYSTKESCHYQIKKLIDDHIFILNNRIKKEYCCNNFLLTSLYKPEKEILILKNDKILYFYFPLNEIPLCHYTFYSQSLYEIGLYFIKKYKLEKNFNIKLDKNIFKCIKRLLYQ